MTQHHCFAVAGTSREVFVTNGIKKTTEDTELEYFVHDHSYHPIVKVPCVSTCQVIRSGMVEHVLPITQSDAVVVEQSV